MCQVHTGANVSLFAFPPIYIQHNRADVPYSQRDELCRHKLRDRDTCFTYSKQVVWPCNETQVYGNKKLSVAASML